MHPIDPGEGIGKPVTYGAGQPDYNALVARVDSDGAIFTLWQLSEAERGAILDGARIGLRILTFGRPLQPVYLAVEGTDGWPYEAVPEEAS